jgi:hypothetical protein
MSNAPAHLHSMDFVEYELQRNFPGADRSITECITIPGLFAMDCSRGQESLHRFYYALTTLIYVSSPSHKGSASRLSSRKSPARSLACCWPTSIPADVSSSLQLWEW